MKTSTWLATNSPDPAVDRAARRVLESTGRISFDDDPASLSRTRTAIRGAQIDDRRAAPLIREFGLFARIVRAFSIEPLTSVEFLDSTVVHPLGADVKRTAELAFGTAARTARRNVAILDDGALRDAARDAARDYPQIFVHEFPAGEWGPLVERGAEEIEVVIAASDLGVAHVMGGAAVAPDELRGEVAIFGPALGDAIDPGAALECPYALVLAGAQLLEFLGEGPVGDRLVKAVKRAVAEGVLPRRLGGTATIDEMTEAVLGVMK